MDMHMTQLETPQQIRKRHSMKSICRNVICLLLIEFCAALSAHAAETFTIVLLPDTQHYTDSATRMVHFNNQTQWITNNVDAENIALAIHAGDIVEHGATIAEWQRADAAIDMLDAIPTLAYGVVMGNHDYDTQYDLNGPTINYTTYFGAARYSGRTWYGGASPDNLSHVQYFFAEGRQYLHIALEWKSASSANLNTTEVITWAQGILDANPGMPTLITTHEYLNTTERSSTGTDIFNALVKTNPQVFLVMGGHVLGENHQTVQNDAGSDVFEVLADFQGRADGGSGWLLMLEFDEGNDTINAITYTPSLDQYETDADSQYSFPVDFDARFGAASPLWVGAPGITGSTYNQAELYAIIYGDAESVSVVWDTTDHSTGTWPNVQPLNDWPGGAGTTNVTLAGLSENSSYVVRFFAENTTLGVDAWSSPTTVTTPLENPPPILGQPEVISVSETNATLECLLTQAPADVTLVWAFTDAGTNAVSAWTGAVGGGSESFPASAMDETIRYTISNLLVGTSYAYRFVAESPYGTDWTEPASFTTSPAADLSRSLVAYFPLNDGSGTTATDIQGANHGTLNGNVVWTASGKIGGALEFTRTARDSTTLGAPYVNGWVSANGLMSNEVLTNTGSYTFSAWIKLNHPVADGAGFGYVLFGANTPTGGNIFRIGVDSSGDNIFSHLTHDLGTTTTFDDTWVLYTMAMDSTGNADFYLNGALALTKAADTNVEREGSFGVANLFHFGMEMEPGKATDGWSGTMDELAIWNRELTPAEVNTLYNGGAGVALAATVPTPKMGTPSVSDPTDDGATAACQLLGADADDVTLVWAYEDAGETTVGTWTAADGGGYYSFDETDVNTLLSRTLTGLEDDTDYAIRFVASDATSSDWSSLSAFKTEATGSSKPPQIAGSLKQGVVAYYPLEEGAGTDVNDISGGNHGSLRGNVAWATGKLGGGLYFTRTAQTGSYTTPANCGFIIADALCANGVLNDTDSYTFSAWVKFAYPGISSWGFSIWGANTAATANGNVMRVGIYDNGVGAFAHGTGSPIGSFDFTDDEWHLFTITFGTDGNADYYVDGALSSAKAADTGLEREKLWSTANLFHFGMEMEGNLATDPFNGALDELTIWNRELSVAEVAVLFNNGDGIDLTTRPGFLIMLL